MAFTVLRTSRVSLLPLTARRGLALDRFRSLAASRVADDLRLLCRATMLGGMPEDAAGDQRRRAIVETPVGQGRRPAQLVDDVVFSLVVLRQPFLAVARVLVEILVFHRVVEAALQRRLRLMIFHGLRRFVEVLVIRAANLEIFCPFLRDRRRTELVDEVAPHEPRS